MLLTADVDAFEGNVIREMLSVMGGFDRLSTTFRFRLGSTTLDERGAADLKRLVAYLAGAPEGTKVTKVGLTDDIGSFESNRSLSLERARQVVDELKAVSTDRPASVEIELAIEDVGAPARVDYSGRLRILSRKIAANARQFVAHPDSGSHKDRLIEAIALFEKFVLALRDGDESIGIFGPERSAKTLKKIQALLAVWEPYSAASERVISGQDVSENLAYTAENNNVLLQAANDLTSEASAIYANPAKMTQANALVIDIAGRQRMLTQKMSKETCGVETGNPAFGTAKDLLETAELFDVSSNALLSGMPEAGIMPPPTQQIVADLQGAQAEWQAIKADVEIFAAAVPAAEVPDSDLYERSEALRVRVIDIVERYRDAAVLKI